MPEQEQEHPIWTKADAALHQATLTAIQQARQTGTPIVVWENGKVKEIPVDEFEALFHANQTPRQFGLGKGKLTIVKEEDEHLEDFKEYMP